MLALKIWTQGRYLATGTLGTRLGFVKWELTIEFRCEVLEYLTSINKIIMRLKNEPSLCQLPPSVWRLQLAEQSSQLFSSLSLRLSASFSVHFWKDLCLLHVV
jgi:hypothetical protein